MPSHRSEITSSEQSDAPRLVELINAGNEMATAASQHWDEPHMGGALGRWRTAEQSAKAPIHRELREVACLLEAAALIADGLVDVLNHAYEHDQRMSDALAAANDAAVRIRNQLELADGRYRS